MNQKLFSPYRLGTLELQNRIVMAPMTRNRAIGNLPNELMALYYQQRAGAGLIITEGTAPSPNALGYANIPGIFSDAQVKGWRKITSAVHAAGGKIMVQLMHTGRMGYPQNLPAGAEIIGASAIAAQGKAIKNTQRANGYIVPREMTNADIVNTRQEFVQAARNAIEAGFDGVELHGANEHLIEQFLSPNSNRRTDQYGGCVENRCRFALGIVAAVGEAIGFDKVGIRLSPYGMNSWTSPQETDSTYEYLIRELNNLDILYIHFADHSAMGGNWVPPHTKVMIRKLFQGNIIHTGGFDLASAQSAIEVGLADLIGFGRLFISNPDLAERMKNGWEINYDWDPTTFYSPVINGYADYPSYQM